ncbi:MAG: hypothetical protein LBN35_01165, partial [Clostridiales Family XIII bacterium]|nr:hypothetical protein [Clostridiales Family XIII bacterium]
EQIDFRAAVEKEAIPVLGIGPDGVPLYGPKGFDSWSLADLILAVAGIILTLIVMASAALKRKKEKKESYREFEYDETDTYKKAKKRWLFLLGALAAAGVILFLLTQDISLPMVLLDGWTIVFAVLFIAEMICVTRRNKKAQSERAHEEAIA